jgi:hypothetical protein
MSNNTKWTKEDVHTLTTLRSKKVGFKYIAKVLGRSESSCRHKEWRLKNPEYWRDIEASKNKRKQAKTDAYRIQNLVRENETLHQLWGESKQSVIALGKQNEQRELRIQELERKLSHSYDQLNRAQGVMEAIQLNMNQYFNPS